MKANYHTHTTRCGHAKGADEDYVRAALSQGFDVLGFSDHVPWPYASGFTSPTVRMRIDELPGYLRSVRELKARYAGQIEVLTGFECEHFPAYMGWLADMAHEQKLDYLILGNHHDQTDETGMYFGNTTTAAQIRAYVDSTIKGLETGLFSYLAHPDLFMRRYRPFDENCRAAAHELCQACRAMGVPMEYNLHMRHVFGSPVAAGYPCVPFFEIVLAERVPVLLGVDAHAPEELSDPFEWDRALGELKPFGELFLDHVPLRGFGE